MSVRYSPGERPVAVTPSGFAVLAPGTSPALAARIHALLHEGRGLGGVLEALTGAYGTSLSAVPPFVVALAERDAVRLAVRGSFAVDVEASSAERISGEGVTTWIERVVGDASRVALIGGSGAAPAEFPVTDGVVLADLVDWVPGVPISNVASTDEQAPATRVSPVIESESESGPARAPRTEPEPALEVEPAAEPEPAPKPAVGASVPPTSTPGLIDSAAVMSVADTLMPPDSTFVPPTDSAAEAPAESPVEATVVRPAPAPAAVLGDHDGATISLAEARALRTGDSAPPPLAPPRPPAPGRIRVSTGQVIALDRTVVIGRRPRSTRVSGTDLPHLVAVDSPQQDISRSHVELRVEGDSIVATDLHTTNGTTLLRPGVDPMRLHPGEGTVVVPGDVIDLGDGITVAIEDLA